MLITIIILNLSLVGLNCFIFWKICQFKSFLLEINVVLNQLNQNLPMLLKEVPLLILLTALEVKNIKLKYIKFKHNFQQIQKVILISQIIYRFSKAKVS